MHQRKYFEASDSFPTFKMLLGKSITSIGNEWQYKKDLGNQNAWRKMIMGITRSRTRLDGTRNKVTKIINKTPTRFSRAADELDAIEPSDLAGSQRGEALLYLASAGARLGRGLVPLVVRLTIIVALDVVEDTVLRNEESLALERTHCIVGSNTHALTTLCMPINVNKLMFSCNMQMRLGCYIIENKTGF